MNIQLSSEVRQKKREKKLVTITTYHKRKLNLLVIGSELLPFPVYVIRDQRKEVYKSFDLHECISTFKTYAYGCISDLNELPL